MRDSHFANSSTQNAFCCTSCDFEYDVCATMATTHTLRMRSVELELTPYRLRCNGNVYVSIFGRRRVSKPDD